MPDDPLATPDQAAVDAALQAYNQAAIAYTGAGQNYDKISTDPKADATSLTAASNQLDNARTQLGATSRDYSNLLGRLAVSHQANARAAKDPNEQRLWASEAEKADAQKELYASEADMYQSKTRAQIDSASQRAQAALSRAQSLASRVPSQNEASQAQALLANTKAAQIPALTADTIRLHSAQIQLAGARTSQALATANRAQAQADVLIPAQAQKYVDQGLLTQAQAEQLKAIGPVRVDELEAKLGLEQTRAAAIRAQIGRQQILPYTSERQPTLTEFQPATGQVTGVPNPGYVNPYLQPLSDRAAAIEAIKNDLASGKFGTGSDAVDYANQLIAGVSQSALLQARGFTPEQYQQAQQQQAQLGQGILSGIQTQGRGMADTLLQYAGKARGLGGFNATPYQSAIGMAGGPGIVQKAMSLIGQIQPISDRNSAVEAISRYGAASALLKASQTGGDDQATTPAPAAAGASPAGPTPPQAQPSPFAQSDMPEGSARNRFLSGALAGAR